MRASKFPPRYGSSATLGLDEMVIAWDRVGSRCAGRDILTLTLRGWFHVVGEVRTTDQTWSSQQRRTNRSLGRYMSERGVV